MADDYRYSTFRTAHMLADLRFGTEGVRPGDRLEAVTLETVSGDTIRIGGQAARPLLVVTGSLTCPMTETSTPAVVDLFTGYRDRVDFVMVSAREAHPGEALPQPMSADEAAARAKEFSTHHEVPFPVAVDTVEGALHRQLGGKPNTAVVVDSDGMVVFRSIWASDRKRLAAALDAVAAGRRPSRSQSRAMMGPMRRAMPAIRRVVGRGGRQARRDLRRSAPPMAAMAWMASVFDR